MRGRAPVAVQRQRRKSGVPPSDGGDRRRHGETAGGEVLQHGILDLPADGTKQSIS